MRKTITGFMSFVILLLCCYQGIAQNKKMTWTSSSKEAKDLAESGAQHMMNIEFEQAYSDFSQALKLDPDFTVVLVFMNNLARGESRKAYAERAQKSALKKTEGEKLFASLTDANYTPEQRRDIWAKLHSMFPDGDMLTHYYAITRATPEERFSAAQDYIKQFPKSPAMYNTIAYYYLQDKKDNEMAKKNFDKYIELYPEGTNSYDSMAEYYLTTGDRENAKKYYTLALEKYPLNNSSLNALQKMDDEKKAADTK